MATTAASILIFASPGASAFSGSRTDSLGTSQGRALGLDVVTGGRVAPAVTTAGDPSADYWRGGSGVPLSNEVSVSVATRLDAKEVHAVAVHLATATAERHEARAAVSQGTRTHAVDPTTYWHALAVKRLHLLGKRERRIVALLVRIHKLRESHRTRASHSQGSGGAGVGSPARIICSVFGAHCSEALHVAQCESTMNVYARNGQYWGLFQEGDYARSTYGFAWNALAQAKSAYRYFSSKTPSGQIVGWSPWQCRP